MKLNDTDAGATGSMMAGTARVDISPGESDARDLGNRELRKGEAVYARVLVLGHGGIRVAIVSVDLAVFSSARVVGEAKSRWGVDHVLLCATHTHAAPTPEGLVMKPSLGDWAHEPVDPGTLIDWPGLSSDPWYAATEEGIIKAIGEAAGRMFAARVVAGHGPFECPYMAHNRRRVHPDGRVEMMWENPGRIPTSPVDPTVGFLRVEDLEGKPRAFVVHYACHPVGTMSEGFVSRDFPGFTVDFIEEQLGPECMAMFLQGAAGDLDPYDMYLARRGRLELLREAGVSLARGALKVSAAVPAPVGGGSLQVGQALLPIANRDGKASTNVGITTVLINGETALVGIPGEPFIQHQLDLRDRSPLANTFLLGLAYGGQGSPYVLYLPTAQAAEEGGYGAGECVFLVPGAGAQIVESALTFLQGLKKP